MLSAEEADAFLMAPKSLEGRLHWSASGTHPHLWRAGGRIRLEDTGDRETLDRLASYNGRSATGRFVLRYARVNPFAGDAGTALTAIAILQARSLPGWDRFINIGGMMSGRTG